MAMASAISGVSIQLASLAILVLLAGGASAATMPCGVGWRVYDEGLARGAYLRPLGDTAYLAPPLTIDDDDLERLCGIFRDAVLAATR